MSLDEELSLQRIENLLTLILLNQLKSKSKKAKAKWLSFVGITNIEIANFLEVYATDVAKYLLDKPTKRKKVRK